MILFGRQFRVSHLARAASVVASAASPLLFRTLRFGPKAAFEFSARALEACREMTSCDPLPQVSIGSLAASRSGPRELWLDLDLPSGEMPPGELAYLCTLVRHWQPHCMVEIGTARGWTTRHLARNSPDDCRIFTVDLPPEDALDPASFSDPQLVTLARQRSPQFLGEPKITQILHDSTTLDWRALLDRPVDLALVDGSHLYEHVRADTERLWDALAPGALVLWHDYSLVEVRRGVRKYLLELLDSGRTVRRLAGSHFAAYVHDIGVPPAIQDAVGLPAAAEHGSEAPCWN